LSSRSDERLRGKADRRGGDVLRRRPADDYVFEIFTARGVRREQLWGSAYRYWSSFALAYVLGRRLSGRIDFLDAGGREGGNVALLENLGLSGHYTCLDLNPVELDRPPGAFEMEYVRSAFADFRPTRRYDAIVFQSSMEFVRLAEDIAWTAGALKPGGFAVVLLITRNARLLYPGFWYSGGNNGRDRDELPAFFDAIGLRIVERMALVGAVGRAVQYLVQLKAGRLLNGAVKRGVGWAFPAIYRTDLMRPFNRVLNPLTAALDRLAPFGRVGHCLVLERKQET